MEDASTDASRQPGEGGVTFTRTSAEYAAGLREETRRTWVVHLVSGAVNGVLLGMPLGLLVAPLPNGVFVGAGLAAAWTAWVAWQSRPARQIHNSLRLEPEGAHGQVWLSASTEALHIGQWWGWRAVPWAVVEVREDGGFVAVRNTRSQVDELYFAADRLDARRAVTAPVHTTARAPLPDAPVVRWRPSWRALTALSRVGHPIPRPVRSAVPALAFLAFACFILCSMFPGPRAVVAAPAFVVAVVAVWQSWRWFPYVALHRWLGQPALDEDPIAMYLRDDGVLYETTAARTSYRWDTLTEVRPTSTFVFVNTADRWGVVPRSALDDADAFIAELRGRAETARRRFEKNEGEAMGPHATVDPALSLPKNPFEAPKTTD